jgi:hypothetical protein
VNGRAEIIGSHTNGVYLFSANDLRTQISSGSSSVEISFAASALSFWNGDWMEAMAVVAPR